MTNQRSSVGALSGKGKKVKRRIKSLRIKWNDVMFPAIIIITSCTIILIVIILGAPILIRITTNFFIDTIWPELLQFFKPSRKTLTLNRNLTMEYFTSMVQDKFPILFKPSIPGIASDKLMSLLTGYASLSVTLCHAFNLTIAGHHGSSVIETRLDDYMVNATFSERHPYSICDHNLLARMPLLEELLTHPVLRLAFPAKYYQKQNQTCIEPSSSFCYTNETYGYASPFSAFGGHKIFSIGKNGSGLAFHQTTQRYNELIFGEKIWYLFSPSKLPITGFNPWETQLEWVNWVLPTLSQEDRPLEVIQGAGEVLYIPDGWYSANIVISNLAVSIEQQSLHVIRNDTAYYHTILGSTEMDDKINYIAALENFKVALQLTVDASTLLKVAETYRKLDDFVRAEKFYVHCIQRNKRHPTAYVGLLDMLLAQHRHDEAVSYLSLAVVNSAKSPELVRLRLRAQRDNHTQLKSSDI